MAGILGTMFRRLPQVMKVTAPALRQRTSNISLASSLCSIPRVQEKAPDFKGMAVVSCGFQEIKLSDFKGKYVVLFFYPLDFTFVCPTELIALDDALEKFEKLNTQIIGCSTDSQYSHLAWMNVDRCNGGIGKLGYPLLSDYKKTISEDYGVLLEKEGVALRGLFIIDPKGIIRIVSVNDLPIGRSVDEILRLIEALKFVEEVGDVCPANWKKGQKAIKPDPEGSKEYFESANK